VHSRKHTRDAALRARLTTEGDSALRAVRELGLQVDDVLALLPRFQGSIVFPDDPDYNKDRALFNPVFNSYPLMIMYCEVNSDVQLALMLARVTPQPLAVRSGGHCTAGFSASSGILIDVSALDDVYVDPNQMFATVGCGCNFGKFRKALAPYGLHVPGGECDDVCIGGYMQGGGYGFTSVTLGMNCDNVISMRVLLADGRIVNASETENYDLWWAMRGGTGGTFGVLLNVTYRLVPLGDVFGWAIIWPLASSGDINNAVFALNTLQDQYMGLAPSPNLNIQVSLCYQPGIVGGLPPSPMYPYLMVRGVWVGNQVEGQAAIQTLCNLPGATTQWTAQTNFDYLNDALLNVPYGMPCFPPGTTMPFEDKASRIVGRKLSSDEWRTLLNFYVTTPNPYSYFYMEFYGGAINQYPMAGSAFVHRNALYNAVLDVFWWNDDQKGPAEAFLEGWLRIMDPLYNGEVYQNYPRLNDPDYKDKYWAEAQNALRLVKLKYDFGKLFTFAQCIVRRGVREDEEGSRDGIPERLLAAIDAPICEYAALQRPGQAGQAMRSNA